MGHSSNQRGEGSQATTVPSIKDLLKNIGIYREPPEVKTDDLARGNLSTKDKQDLLNMGFVSNELSRLMQQETMINFDRQCLRGDVRVRLLDGTAPTIREMAQNESQYVGKSVLSVNPETLAIEPDKILACSKTRRNARMVRVLLDNDEHIDCTPDHKFMLRDGKFCEAQDLQPGTSLMPLYRKRGLKSQGRMSDYWLVYDPAKGGFRYEHRVAASYFHGKIKRGYVVHHKDFTKDNNDPLNLQVMSKADHVALHTVHLTPEQKRRHARAVSRALKGRVHGPEYRDRVSREMGNRWSDPVTAAKYREHLRGLHCKRTPKEIRFCACGCGESFEVYVTRSRKYMQGHNNRVTHKTAEFRRRKSEQTKRLHEAGKLDSSNTGFSAERWKDPEYKARVIAAQNRGKKLARLNHKVVSVRVLTEREDTYDLSIERNHNFPLESGVFVHNSVYKEADRAVLYPLVGAGVEVYANTATVYSYLNNSTVWVTAKNRKYVDELTKLFDRINLEEVIFDWAWNLTAFGDLFVQPKTKPGLGIYAIDDNQHAANVSRLDYNGRLIGFYETPFGQNQTTRQLLPPWEYVHFRILGVKKKRPLYTDPMYSEYRSISIIAPETRRVTSRYGSSVLTNALPVYKRLRMAEDSVMLARLSKGVERYIWKLKVEAGNFDAVSEMIDQYGALLKRARALNTNTGQDFFDEKYNPMAVNEDIVAPVFGEVGDLTPEKLGGNADIRWIADVKEYREQLSAALAIPLPILMGSMEGGGWEPGQALEKLDIRFARTVRRVQRGIIGGIRRLCQIHLAYMGMNPSPDLFEVHMDQASTAEEESLKESLDRGTDIVDKFMDMVAKITATESGGGAEGLEVGGQLDRIELFNYLNRKILKLNDFDLRKFITKVKSKDKDFGSELEQAAERWEREEKEALNEQRRRRSGPSYVDGDLRAHLPLQSGGGMGRYSVLTEANWRSVYGGMKLKVEGEKPPK